MLSNPPCPACGGFQVRADQDYGTRLRRQAFRRQVWLALSVWIGLALCQLGDLFYQSEDKFPTAWRYGLLALIVVVAMFHLFRSHRQIYGPASQTRFPPVAYTCLSCWHEWDSLDTHMSTTG